MAAPKAKAAPAAALSSDDLASLASAQIGALSTGLAVSLETSDIAALSTGQAAALATADVLALNTEQVTVISTCGTISLTSGELVSLSTVQICALADGDAMVMGTGQIDDFSTDLLALLDTDQGFLDILETARISLADTPGDKDGHASDAGHYFSVGHQVDAPANVSLTLTADLGEVRAEVDAIAQEFGAIVDGASVTLGVSDEPAEQTMLEQLVDASRQAQALGDYTMHAEIEGLIGSLHSLKMRLAAAATLPAAFVKHLQALL